MESSQNNRGRNLWNSGMLLLGAIGALSSFLPLVIFSQEYSKPTNLIMALQSIEFKYSVASSIAICLKLLIDVLLDYSNHSESPVVGLKSLLILILSALVPNIAFILFAFDNTLPLFQCITSARYVVSICSAVVYFEVNGNLLQSNKITYFTVSCFCLAIVLGNISYFSKYSGQFIWLSVVFTVVTSIGIMSLCISWMKKISDMLDNGLFNRKNILFCVIIISCSSIVILTMTLKISILFYCEPITTILTAISYAELLFLVISTSYLRFNDNGILEAKVL